MWPEIVESEVWDFRLVEGSLPSLLEAPADTRLEAHLSFIFFRTGAIYIKADRDYWVVMVMVIVDRDNMGRGAKPESPVSPSAGCAHPQRSAQVFDKLLALSRLDLRQILNAPLHGR